MYTFLKSVLKKIIPWEVIVNNEFFLRKLMLPLYRGENHQCNICGAKLKKFAQLPDGTPICVACGSLPRTRRLYKLLTNEFIKNHSVVLDFSPSRIIYKKLKERKDISYFPTDFENEFTADYHFDIRNIAVNDNTFDLVICYHILEHIDDDLTAMKELFRVLKKNGKILIQTPFKAGEIYENPEFVSPEERLLHFGQEDHVRIYSVEGLQRRLEKAGFQTEVLTFGKDSYHGMQDNEKIIVCAK